MRKVRDFFISVQGTEIPILSYEITDDKVERKNIYYDYQNALTNALARKYVDNYTRKSKQEIRDIVLEISNYFTSSIHLDNKVLIDYFIAKYLSTEPTPNYATAIVKNAITENINQVLDNHNLITLDYSQELELDPEYRRIENELRNIMGVIRKDIISAGNEESALELGENLKRLLQNYCDMKKNIIAKIVYKLRSNQDYNKNKSRAYNLVPSIVKENLDIYLDIDSNTVSLEEVVESVPDKIIVRAADEFLENKKYNYLSKLFSVMNYICRKEDGSRYSDTEKEAALLARNTKLLKVRPFLVELYLREAQPEVEPLDSSHDIKGPYTFASYYDPEEMEYYGHDYDDREEYPKFKI